LTNLLFKKIYIYTHTHILAQNEIENAFLRLQGPLCNFWNFKGQKVILWNLGSNCNFGKSGLKDNFAKVINQNGNFEKIWDWFVILEKLCLWTGWE